MAQDAAAHGAVVVVREIDASPQAVRRAGRGPGSVRQRWDAAGLGCPRADVGSRVRGAIVVAVQAPLGSGGFPVHDRWTCTALDEPTRIALVGECAGADAQPVAPAAAGIPPGVPARSPHVVGRGPLLDGRTRATITGTGCTSEEARRLSQQGQERVVDEMQALLDVGLRTAGAGEG